MKRTRSWKALATAGLVFGAASAATADPATIAVPAGSPFPESVTATADGTLYAGSLTHGGIVRAKPGSAEAEVWIKPGAFGTRSTFGVLADEANGLLWVCSNDASQLGAKGPTEIEGSFVKGFDLTTGEGRISVELPSRPAICNDMAIGPDKALYVSNTAQPQILRLAFGETKMQVWAQDDRLKGGLDGLAFGADGFLYANTFISGELFRMEVDSGAVGKIEKIETARPLKFPDGLKADGAGFLMVEGGGPLSQVTIADGKATLTMIKEFAGPTGLTRVGDVIWVAEGQIVNLVDPSLKGQMPKSFQFRSIKADR
ncbi:SMP-30/gluconolactonase/LRE family protein [Chenggangzhangella methanolivorans]|uniref:SMP-30/gluconolactonase/LRE family protein n=1 Tax=Chenggangzhangella methanolivorans TaxID=1437009 RepID=UPI003615E975